MIISCYSYKGGVGRTQLIANLATYLCNNEKKKVLLIDWDLEAPGLHYYFGKTNQDINQPGLLNVLTDYVNFRYNKTTASNAFPVFSAQNIVNLTKKGKGKVDLIPSGNYADPANYFNTLLNFNWFDFYETLDGKRYIEHLKENLRSLGYHYIFIDCRTGINNYSDICNIQMPDLNILVIAPNDQDFEGSLQMAHNIIESGYVQSGKYRKPLILPILSRVEGEAVLYPKYFTDFQEKFSFTIQPLCNILHDDNFNMNKYFKDTIIYYLRDMAVGEKVVFSSPETPNNILYTNYRNIANYIKALDV